MRVRVDHERCEGHARCNAINPDLFELDDVGYSSIDTVEVPPTARGTPAARSPTARRWPFPSRSDWPLAVVGHRS